MAQEVPVNKRSNVMASLGMGYIVVEIKGSTGGGPGMGTS